MNWRACSPSARMATGWRERRVRMARSCWPSKGGSATISPPARTIWWSARRGRCRRRAGRSLARTSCSTSGSLLLRGSAVGRRMRAAACGCWSSFGACGRWSSIFRRLRRLSVPDVPALSRFADCVRFGRGGAVGDSRSRSCGHTDPARQSAHRMPDRTCVRGLGRRRSRAADPARWRQGRNDLRAPAIALVPEIDEVLAVLKAQLPGVARMSGSGATCFALFASEAERDAGRRSGSGTIIRTGGCWRRNCAEKKGPFGPSEVEAPVRAERECFAFAPQGPSTSSGRTDLSSRVGKSRISQPHDCPFHILGDPAAPILMSRIMPPAMCATVSTCASRPR